MLPTLPLQTPPEVIGPPFDRLLLVLLALAALLLVGRMLLNLAWKLVVIATLLVAVVGAASVLGLL